MIFLVLTGLFARRLCGGFQQAYVPRLYNYADFENTDKKTTLNAEEDVKEDTGEKQKRQKETCLNRVEKAFGKTIESERMKRRKAC